MAPAGGMVATVSGFSKLSARGRRIGARGRMPRRIVWWLAQSARTVLGVTICIAQRHEYVVIQYC